MTLAEWERTTDTTTDQFMGLMKFIFDNGLMDEVNSRLNSKGLDRIRLSVQHVREAQDLLREHFKKKGSPSSDAIIMSAHVDGVC